MLFHLFLAIILCYLHFGSDSHSPSFADEELKKVAVELLDLQKGIVGLETFSKAYTTVQKALGEKKNKRKTERAQEVWKFFLSL